MKAKEDASMSKSTFRPLWLGLMLGALIYTGPDWLLNPDYHKTAHYDAPWIYPGNVNR